VNLSWDGAFSSVINEAGAYLKQRIGGMLFMSGVNGRKQLDYPAQPDIYAIAMTDQDDEPRSASGAHIDFAAPGWEIYSTTTNSGYEVDSGSSYSTPLVAGMAGWIMSVNPNLGPAEIEAILKASAIDLGPPGWDPDFGWGRVDFGLVARNTFATLPLSRAGARYDGGLSITAVRSPGATYRLFRSTNLAGWELVANAAITFEGDLVLLRDPSPPPVQAYYKVELTLPRD
jgi:subtilisin family serine protease